MEYTEVSKEREQEERRGGGKWRRIEKEEEEEEEEEEEGKWRVEEEYKWQDTLWGKKKKGKSWESLGSNSGCFVWAGSALTSELQSPGNL